MKAQLWIALACATACMLGSSHVLAEGDLRATTQDGRKVILKPDGSWRFDAGGETTPSAGLQTPANANAAETFSRGNFRIRYDDSKWLIQSEPDGSKWKFTLRGEDVYAIIIPEGLAAQTRALKEVALNNLRKAAKQVNIVKEETRKVNGKDVLFMHVDATVNEIPLTYYYYIYGDNRGVVQLIVYTTPSQQARYEPAIFDLLNGLEVIR